MLGAASLVTAIGKAQGQRLVDEGGCLVVWQARDARPKPKR